MNVSIAEKFRVKTLPNQCDVSRSFCKQYCCAWRGSCCGTIFAPDYRKGKCLWSLDEMKKKGGGDFKWRINRTTK